MPFPSNSIVGASPATFALNGSYSFPFGDPAHPVVTPFTFTIPTPAGIVAGDLLVAFIGVSQVGAHPVGGAPLHPITVPAGWNRFTTFNTGPQVDVLYRTVDGSEGASTDFIYDSPKPGSGGMQFEGFTVAVRGQTNIPIPHTLGWGLGSRTNGPVTLIADAMLLIGMFPNNGVTVPTNPDGTQVLVNAQSTAPSQTTIAAWAAPFLGPGTAPSYQSIWSGVTPIWFVLSVVPGPSEIPVPPPVPPAPIIQGELIGLTFKEQEQVIAWHRHPFGGTNPSIESICCVPAPDGSQDELWMIVSRTINGVTKRYVEYIAPHFLTGDSLATDAHYADCSATYMGVPTSVVTGLSFLEGETVGVLADGASHPDCVVTGGQISLQRQATVVEVGIRQASQLTTMALEFPTPGGTAQGKKKRISSINVRMLNTLGGKFGREDTQDPAQSVYDIVEVRAPSDQMDQPLDVISGFWPPDTYDFPWPAGYEQEGRVTYINDTMFPATIVAIYPEVTSED